MPGAIKTWLIAGGIVLALVGALLAATYLWGRSDGGSGAVVKQATAQRKQDNQRRKADAKIDKQTPFDAGSGMQFEWMRNHVVRE